MRRILILALVVATAVGAAAAPAVASPAKQPPPTKHAYIKRGDAICKTAGSAIEQAIVDLGIPADRAPTDAELQAFVDRAIEITRQEISRLQKLTPPRGDAKQLRRVYSAVLASLKKIAADPTLLIADKNPLTAAGKLATAYGFKVCGNSAQ